MNGHLEECECATCKSLQGELNENEKKEKEHNDMLNMFGEQEPASQLIVSSDDDGPEQDDMIDLCTPPRVKRLPGKRPHRVKRFLDLEAEDIEDDVPPSSDDSGLNMNDVWPRRQSNSVVHEEVPLQNPDLEAYFRQRQFRHVSNFTKISQCRTYANYLAQVEKAKSESMTRKKIKKGNI